MYWPPNAVTVELSIGFVLPGMFVPKLKCLILWLILNWEIECSATLCTRQTKIVNLQVYYWCWLKRNMLTMKIIYRQTFTRHNVETPCNSIDFNITINLTSFTKYILWNQSWFIIFTLGKFGWIRNCPFSQCVCFFNSITSVTTSRKLQIIIYFIFIINILLLTLYLILHSVRHNSHHTLLLSLYCQ